MKFKDLTVRIIAAGMASAILMSTASCSLKDFRNKIINEPLSAQELARRVITVINNRRDAADVYASIPEEQRDGVSYSYFIQYIDILSEISETNGDEITSFRMLSADEVYEITEGQDDSYYGDIIGVEFLYDEETSTPTYMMLSRDEKGITYLSEEWITDSITMFNYAEHYFQLLSDQNKEGIYTLLRPDYDELFTDNAVYNIAQEYIDYYQFCVRSDRSQYHIVKLIPEHIEISIPETVIAGGNRVIPHTVDIRLEDGSYVIEDTLPNEPDETLLNISGGSVDLTCGELYTSSVVFDMLGTPTGSLYYDNGILSINYSGLILIFEADEYDETDGSWSGTLSTFRITSGIDYMIGQGVHIGMDKSQLLEIYPFIHVSSDEDDGVDLAQASGYSMTVRDGGVTYNVQIEFDDHDRINFIKITKD